MHIIIKGFPATCPCVALGRAGQKRLLRWLQRLRPAESAAHMELIAASTAADPDLAGRCKVECVEWESLGGAWFSNWNSVG